MREIKFQYIYELLGVTCKPTLTLEQIEEGLASKDSFPSNATIIAKRQFIGLKGCNGVEIYEGDIVRDHVGVGVVLYSEIKPAFKVDYRDGFAKWFIDYMLSGERESIEVIGNIYQNKNLIDNN